MGPAPLGRTAALAVLMPFALTPPWVIALTLTFKPTYRQTLDGALHRCSTSVDTNHTTVNGFTVVVKPVSNTAGLGGGLLSQAKK